MSQISSLKSLDYFELKTVQNIMFAYFPGAKNCLLDLERLNCSSSVHSDFFYQISQVCQNIQTLSIVVEDPVSDGLTDLIII